MPLEGAIPDAAARAADLNGRYRHHAAVAVLGHALRDPQVGSVALVSSFGAESVVLLHMLSRLDRTVPVVFVDTGRLFAETLDYRRRVAATLGLTDLRTARPAREALDRLDPDGELNGRDPDACCAMRKVAPLAAALDGFDAWITGRKRFQGGDRAALDLFEADGAGRIKVNPLAHWAAEDVEDYVVNNRLPRHPLATRGYPSIGCAPCTAPVAPGEDARAGRWRGRAKDECGIHFANGVAVRGPAGGAR